MQFSNWKFTKLLSHPTPTKCALVSLCFGTAVLLTCRVRDEESKQRVAQATAQDVLPSESLTDTKSSAVSCSAERLPNFSFVGELQFGKSIHSVVLSLKEYDSDKRISVLTGKHKIHIDARDLKLEPIDVEAICSQTLHNGNQVPIVSHSPFLTSVMERLGPDCRFETAGNGVWKCLSENQQPNKTLTASLNSLDQQILKKWNRHPYLLTRRFTTTKQLARLINRQESGAAKSGFCQLISVSLREELPLALRTGAAHEVLCQGEESDFKAVAPFILDASVRELDFLANKFSSDSQSGALTVQIPVTPDRSQSGRDFWVTLQAISYSHEVDEETSLPSPELNFCWHPLLHDTAELALVATHLNVIYSDQHKYCTRPAEKPLKKPDDPHRYVASSITSESEFIITQGKTKLLRLPEGSYEYVVKKQMNLMESSSQSSEPAVSKGTLSWRKPSNRTIIK